MKKIIIKIVSAVLLLSMVLSIAIIPASATEYPNGSTLYFENKNGTEKTVNISAYSTKDGHLLKKMVMKGPLNWYWCESLHLWGYDYSHCDLPWKLLIDCEVATGFGGNTINDGRSWHIIVGAEFYALSGDSYSGTVYFTPQTCTTTVRHILVGGDGSETLYSSSSAVQTYDEYWSAYSKSITGYQLMDGYATKFAGDFNWDMIGAYPNTPEENYDARWNDAGEGAEGRSHFWFDNRTLNVDFKYKINSYTITYDADGGTGAPGSQTKYYGTNINLSTQIPTKEGYNFVGWSYSPSDDSVEFSPGETYKSNADLSLYAVWEHAGYAIRYDANGGTGAPATQYKKQGEILSLRSTKPTRLGYTFMGWSTTPGPVQAVKYTPGGQYWLDEPAPLYAVWRENAKTYTVTYDANGGTNAPASQTKTEGTALTLSTSQPAKYGYEFLGWSASPTATVPTYYPGSKYTTDSSITLYAVWEKPPSLYTITYNANGGTNAPSAQVKTENVDITLSTQEPTRSGYKFLGWSTASTSNTVSYRPGDLYTENTGLSLYAVWREDNYDISVSNLTVSPSSVAQYSDTSVSVRVDNWDKNKAYSNIPVELLYNGSVIASKYIDLGIYGVATVNFTLNVGETTGNNTLTARVNWSDRNNETDPNDNSVSTAVNVTPYEYDLYISSVTPNAPYREGTDVITSFMIYNDSEKDILPENDNIVYFTVYYYDLNGTRRTITTQTWTNTVIPAKGSNLVYFKWTVPDGLAGRVVYIDGIVNAYASIYEQDHSNNSTTLALTIADKLDSQPSNTSYGEKPSDYEAKELPSTSYGTATWNQWVYSNGELVLTQYGVGISTTKPILYPSESVSSAEVTTAGCVIKSGYGIGIEYSPNLTVLSGYNTPTMNSFTKIQNVYATFPEYGYNADAGNAAVLVLNNGVFEFVPNEYSNTGESVHFIPVWMDNGRYDVSVYAGDVWTPAGMIYTVVNSGNMEINGTMYDDFYVGD